MARKPAPVQQVEFIVGSAAAAARVFAVDASTIGNWAGRGCPGIQPRRYDIREISRWIARKVAERDEQLAKRAVADPMMVGEGSSPALEKYRAARARVAEIQADEAERSVVSVDDILRGMRVLMSTLGEAPPKLGEQFGREAQRLLQEHLAAANELLDQFEQDPLAWSPRGRSAY